MNLPRAAARMIAIGFPGLCVPDETRALMARGVSAAILFKRNVESAKQVFDLTSQLKHQASGPMLIAVDQEGGRVMRLGRPFTPVPSMRSLGQTRSGELARAVGQLLASELRAVNIDLDFAPVLDVDTNPKNPVIADRSFGADPN